MLNDHAICETNDETRNHIALLPNLFTPDNLEMTDHVKPGIFLRDIAHTCIAPT